MTRGVEMNQRLPLSGVILAGGEGRRMGGCDKGLSTFLGRPLVAHVRERLEPHVEEVVLNANRHLEDYRALGCRVVCDREAGYQGPLMGIWSGLLAARQDWVVVVPCDTPALPMALVPRLWQGIGAHDIAVAHDGERAHPVVALMRRDLADDLAAALADGERKIDRWYARHNDCYVDFSDCPEAFANLNRPAEREALERRLAANTPTVSR
ncbi:molybdopterin-guanine dinucleotide biosynthesis protein A [Franzmannia pantelleriensis]|uniref:Molybdenum cofactor guanylyltransferase n=1 Tax=Franzmannia pantelleriensis TaxID=48727 RepID=A0A1G9M8X5_9GAMM|nr:molybdenum cofactor guanylyltransferase MobA [Halomonas pantelleriensis]SDL70563.1 molybdopterin-guanine dinucleotide biosynthesis protein A [Halomonas pantelleriensis]